MPDYTADPQVVPYLLYEDAGAAMDWLTRVFGFAERQRDEQHDGIVRHGELVTGNGGVIMLGSPGPGFRGPAKLGEVTQLVCVTVTDLEAHRVRAQAAGAEVTADLYGSEGCGSVARIVAGAVVALRVAAGFPAVWAQAFEQAP